jgi:hypothetical protein
MSKLAKFRGSFVAQQPIHYTALYLRIFVYLLPIVDFHPGLQLTASHYLPSTQWMRTSSAPPSHILANSSSLNPSEQRELQTRMEKKQMKEFMNVITPDRASLLPFFMPIVPHSRLQPGR